MHARSDPSPTCMADGTAGFEVTLHGFMEEESTKSKERGRESDKDLRASTHGVDHRKILSNMVPSSSNSIFF